MRALAQPASVVILLASIVHILRRDALDTALFLGTLALIGVDATRPLRDPMPGGTTGPSGRRSLVVAGVCAGYGLLVGAMPRAGCATMTALAIPGVLALVAVLATGSTTSEPLHAEPSTRPPRWWLWLVVALAVAGWELTAFLSQSNADTPSYAHPTLSTIGEPLLDASWVRMVVLASWLAAGWWLVRVAGPGPRSGRRLNRARTVPRAGQR